MTVPEKPSVENPYAAPTAATGFGPTHVQRPSGVWVRQVRIVAILMCVQGALEFLLGLYFVAMGFVFPNLMAMQQQNQIPPQQVAMISDILFTFFVIGGCIVTLLGILRFAAGILGFNFRSRGLGIVSHLLGLLSLFSFYCVITGLPLCIYGCLVYFNPEVKSAFQMRSEGQSVSEILAQFY